jgi:hypothetical protein
VHTIMNQYSFHPAASIKKRLSTTTVGLSELRSDQHAQGTRRLTNGQIQHESRSNDAGISNIVRNCIKPHTYVPPDTATSFRRSVGTKSNCIHTCIYSLCLKYPQYLNKPNYTIHTPQVDTRSRAPTQTADS